MNGFPDTLQDVLRKLLDAVDGAGAPSDLDVNGIPRDAVSYLRDIVKALADGTFGGPQSLAVLTDVDLTDPQDGDVLTYDAESGKWKNTAAAPASDDT